MKQYQLAMPQQVFSGETGMQALESLAARHKKAAVFTDEASGHPGFWNARWPNWTKRQYLMWCMTPYPPNPPAIRPSRSSIPSVRAVQT